MWLEPKAILQAGRLAPLLWRKYGIEPEPKQVARIQYIAGKVRAAAPVVYKPIRPSPEARYRTLSTRSKCFDTQKKARRIDRLRGHRDAIICAQECYIVIASVGAKVYCVQVKNDITITVDDQLLEPVLALVRECCRCARKTPGLADESFARLGLQRVLETCESGRAFLQERGDAGDTVARATFFGARNRSAASR